MTTMAAPSKNPWLSRTIAAAIFSSLPLLSGCGDESTSGETTTTTTTTSGTTTTETAACATDPRALVYTKGLAQTSDDGTITVTFVDADPAPPAKGNNTWTVQIDEENVGAVKGATIETTAYMPDHGHTSPIKPTATAVDDAGTYEITPINLFMPGIWEITLTVTPAGEAARAVKFTFCIAG